ncbi:ATP-dependent RNA helicase DDX24 [Chelonus insularis]|uniref:ATP-dependent RNA helicase DDX24 n=1 Tax=Chelonus insularis TaxID=460826 RepID=UPI00158A1BD0|nr:ATP-dependent RNA helicase DDX24 [Chelonus insularis]
MTKSREISSQRWKPVKLEGSILSSGIENLIGIEELTDYKLEEKSLISTKNSSKRKNLLSVNDDNEELFTKKQKLSKPRELQKKKINKNKNNKMNSNDNQQEVVNSIKKKQNFVTMNSEDHQQEEKNESSGSDHLNSSENFDREAWSSLGVPDPILRALEDQNFSTPTPIQSLTLAPAILGRRDILGAAETGSGKTLAFGIPILTRIMEHKKKSAEKHQNLKNISNRGATNKGWIVSEKQNDSDEESEELDDIEETPHKNFGCVKVIDNLDLEEDNNETKAIKKPLYALILTPTRELAIQIKNHLTKAAKYTDIKIAVVVGGMAAVKQERILSKGPEIVIATPGRLWELIEQGNAHLNQLDSLKYLTIDETDRMLEKGHFQELHQLMEKMNFNENAVKHRQVFVFSATLTLVHDIPDFLMRKKQKSRKSNIYKLTPGQKLQKVIDMLKIKNPKIVDVTQSKGTAETLTECRIACTIDHKDYYLYYFLRRHPGRTLVFCNSIGCVRRLATLFGILQCNPLPLHANMIQRQRLKNLERFQEDPNGLLIATDVAARGLDIPNIEHVIHYQVPRTSESYIHRSGRTARAWKEGITVLMMEPSELQFYTKLCQTLGRTQDMPAFPVVDRLLIAVKECVNTAREIDKLELMCRRNNTQKGWLKKAAEDMDLLLDEDQIETTMEEQETATIKRQLKIKKHQLSALLSKPLFPKGYSGKYLNDTIEFELLPDKESAVEKVKKVIIDSPKLSKAKTYGTFKKIKRSIK